MKRAISPLDGENRPLHYTTMTGANLKGANFKDTTVTKELLSLREWLLAESCGHVGMESTGVLWRPVYDRLFGSFEQALVNNGSTMK